MNRPLTLDVLSMCLHNNYFVRDYELAYHFLSKKMFYFYLLIVFLCLAIHVFSYIEYFVLFSFLIKVMKQLNDVEVKYKAVLYAFWINEATDLR